MRPRQVSDQDILDAARDCFLEHGASCATTVIAERVGLSQAALFKRFGTKQNLMVQALGPPEKLPWLEVIHEGPDDRPVDEQLREIARLIARFFEHKLPEIQILLRAVDPELVREHVIKRGPLPTMMALHGWLVRARERGLVREDLDIQTVMYAMVGGLHSHGMLARMSGGAMPQRPSDEHADALIDELWKGMKP